MYWVLALLFLCTSCSQSSDAPQSHEQLGEWLQIFGRNDDNSPNRQPIYRVRLPKGWIKQAHVSNESINDTTKPIYELLIPGKDGSIKITIHNFPTNKMEDRTPPGAQVARWKGQFEKLDTVESCVTPQTFNGYCGSLFKGIGIIQEKPMMMLAWAMQITPKHYQALSDNSPKHKQMRADFTIKAVGPEDLMEEYYPDIVNFAHSFELIEDVPSHS